MLEQLEQLERLDSPEQLGQWVRREGQVQQVQ